MQVLLDAAAMASQAFQGRGEGTRKNMKWGYRHVGLVCWDHFSQQMDREKQRIDYQHRAKESNWSLSWELLWVEIGIT